MAYVFVSVGNSDNKLSQREWSELVGHVRDLLAVGPGSPVIRWHGEWFSASDSPWQNACWSVEIHYADTIEVAQLRNALREVAAQYRQDSICWSKATTEFLGPTDQAVNTDG